MSRNEVCSNKAAGSASAASVDLKLEVLVILVSGVDRAKEFYSRLGWRPDTHRSSGDDFRLVQFTPPGSGSSTQFGVNLTSTAPGSAQSLLLTVSDIEAARRQLVAQGIDASGHFTLRPGPLAGFLPSAFESPRQTPSVSAIVLSSRSEIRMATVGCCKRSRIGFRGALQATRRNRPREILPKRGFAPRGAREHEARTVQTDPNWLDWYANTWRANNPAKNCSSSPRSAIARRMHVICRPMSFTELCNVSTRTFVQRNRNFK
jgi:hypothetical protein